MFSIPLRNVLGHLPRWRTTIKTRYPVSTNASGPQVSSHNRLRKYARRAGYIAVCCGTVYVFDKTLNASSLIRTIRTLWTVRENCEDLNPQVLTVFIPLVHCYNARL
jgi:hypothetical protein